MKNVLFFLMVIMSLFIFSCSSEDKKSTANDFDVNESQNDADDLSTDQSQTVDDDQNVPDDTQQTQDDVSIPDNETTDNETTDADLAERLPYQVVDTNVVTYFDNNTITSAQSEGSAFYGQDAHYKGASPSYTDNGDGTITDNVTGLMWEQDMGEQITYTDALEKAENSTLGNYTDWRVASIKELYSLILFTGSNGDMSDESTYVKYIDTNYFVQPFGDTSSGVRIIDAQTRSATQYVGKTMNNDDTIFGVNFIDGRIKGYPKNTPGTQDEKVGYYRLVRLNTNYGKNDFVDNGDTVSDLATGLVWQKANDGTARDWEGALAYCEGLSLDGKDDWRLPNAKELHTIVDYTRSPQTTNSPAIDPIFSTTSILDPDGNTNYPYFWTSTTHLDGIEIYDKAVYFAFGEAQGEMNDTLMDVHGAGAQRSDPKTGNQSDYPLFFGPQGDVRYVFNYARCVRDL